MPSPGRLVTVIAPLWLCTMPCTTASPRPLPSPGCLVVKNGSKMCSSVSGRDAGAVVVHADADVAPSPSQGRAGSCARRPRLDVADLDLDAPSAA